MLVNKLWNNGSGKPHKTPFERGIVEFNITCEQASHIHLLKHRLANINGESARYKELKEDKFYLPEDWKGINLSQDIGFDATEYGPDGQDNSFYYAYKGQEWLEILQSYTEQGNLLYHQALKDFESKLGRKRAKESARFFKTMNSQLTLSVMMNMSCFKNFVTLRNDEAAQREIAWIAQDMIQAVKDIEGNPFKATIEAFKI